MEWNNNVHEKHVIARSYYLTWKCNNTPLAGIPGRACSAVNNIFSSIHFCPPSLRAVHLIRILYLLLVDR